MSGQPTPELLRCTLEASVPFRMLDLKQQGGPLDRDWEEARAFADVLACEGDNILFQGHKKGDTAHIMRGLIRALAVMAFAPGGVTAWGLHFDAGAPDSSGGAGSAPAPVADIDAERIKALLIEMRRYFISHNCPTGECVAWRELKAMFGVGQCDEDDEAWMTQHTGKPFRLRRSDDERPRRRGE